VGFYWTSLVSCINIYIILGKSLWRLLMCSCTLVLRLVMYVQYGHFRWGFFPHSSLKWRLRFAFHVYTLWHLGHGNCEFPVFCKLIFAARVLPQNAVFVSWLLIIQFCVACPRSGVPCDPIAGPSSLVKKSSCPNTVTPSVRTGTDISYGIIITVNN
jgi:hypothetical protein